MFIFRGEEELRCWVDLASTNIRELLINHGCSSQRDAAGVTSFVRLAAHMCACVHAQMILDITLYLNIASTLHTVLRKKILFYLLQPQASSCISCAAVVALVASLSHKESFHKRLSFKMVTQAAVDAPGLYSRGRGLRFWQNQPLEGRTHCNQADTHLRGVEIIRDRLKGDKRQKGKDLNREGSLKRGCRSGDLWLTGNGQRAHFPWALREQNRPGRWVFPLDNAQQAPMHLHLQNWSFVGCSCLFLFP